VGKKSLPTLPGYVISFQPVIPRVVTRLPEYSTPIPSPIPECPICPFQRIYAQTDEIVKTRMGPIGDTLHPTVFNRIIECRMRLTALVKINYKYFKGLSDVLVLVHSTKFDLNKLRLKNLTYRVEFSIVIAFISYDIM
jgi:hypothetical protein